MVCLFSVKINKSIWPNEYSRVETRQRLPSQISYRNPHSEASSKGLQPTVAVVMEVLPLPEWCAAILQNPNMPQPSQISAGESGNRLSGKTRICQEGGVETKTSGASAAYKTVEAPRRGSACGSTQLAAPPIRETRAPSHPIGGSFRRSISLMTQSTGFLN